MSVLNFKHLFITTSALALTACGSATTGTSTSNNTPVKTISELVTSKTELSGTGAKISLVEKDATTLHKDNTIKFKAVGNDTYEFTFNGQKHTFKESDYIKANGGFYRDLGNGNVVVANRAANYDFISSYKYADIAYASQQDQSNKEFNMSFTDLGSKTINMTNAPKTAKYKGEMLGYVASKNLKTGKTFEGFSGKTTLNADFSGNKISGHFDNFVTLGQTNIVIPGKLDIANGTISKNGFSAQLKGDTTLNTRLAGEVTGELKGSFYGTNAEEVAGTFFVNSDDLAGTGGFLGKE